MSGLHRAVAATVLDAELPGASPSLRRDVEAFVDGQLAAAPQHVRVGLGAIEAVLGALTVVRTARPFARLGAERRAALVEAWAASPLPGVGQYVRLVRGLSSFAAAEHRDGPAWIA
jgi:hypothetical protein